MQNTSAAAHLLAMSEEFQQSDYSMVVKRRDNGPKPWRWEIWVAGRSRHVERSAQPYATMAEATREGKAALKACLSRLFPHAA
jgi:hypothetical protein